jgi:hypothetical protein
MGIAGMFVAATGITLTTFMRRPEYLEATGAPPLPTMGAEAQWLRPGERTRADRTTVSRVYHVIEGHGLSRVGETQLAWAPAVRELRSAPSLPCRAHQPQPVESRGLRRKASATEACRVPRVS